MSINIGLDIGYSNLKMVYSDAAKASGYTEFALPGGCGWQEDLPMRIDVFAANAPDLPAVEFDGKKWVAGVSQAKLDTVRETHDGFSRSPSYKALFYSALHWTGATEVDHLVTGLPVDLSMNADVVAELSAMMTGTHQVTPSKTVVVKNVRVIPQPAGGYAHFLRTSDNAETMAQSRAMVLDAGYYSTGFITTEFRTTIKEASGTSMLAMSTMLERTNRAILKATGSSFGVARLEDALREGRTKIAVRGEYLQLNDYVEPAAYETAKAALSEVRSKSRMSVNDIDFILLIGGGGHLFEAAVRDAFPKTKVFLSECPVLVNARGFWSEAQLLSGWTGPSTTTHR